MIKEIKITTLSELALDLKINKTKLNYYAWLGLIIPIKEVGKTLVFNREETIKRIELIKVEKNKGLTLKEIAEKFKK
jgi:DNA-binding transcriptional MerR regulator